MCNHPAATVLLGERSYQQRMSWKRKDRILVGETLIGVIHLSDQDRQGVTTCLSTGETKSGRVIEWCVSRHTSAESNPQCGMQNLQEDLICALDAAELEYCA